jgi:ribosome biogenesis GTPase
VVTLSARRDVGPLMPLLAGQRSLLVGQSGMGKSTLINALVPGAQARVGEISSALGSGRHTTTATLLYSLPVAAKEASPAAKQRAQVAVQPAIGTGDPESDAEGAWLIDSPGMQEFGLAHLSRGQIEDGFREMRALSGHCQFRDCSHTHEPGCAAIAATERGQFDRRRLASLVRLLAEHAAQRRW